MQCGSGGQVDIDAQNVLQQEFQLGELDEAEARSRIAIDEHVDVRTGACLVACMRAVEIKRIRTEGSKRLGVFADLGHQLVALHAGILPQIWRSSQLWRASSEL